MRRIFISLLLLMPLVAWGVEPQTKSEEGSPDIVTRIQEESEGNVTIEIPDDLLKMLMTPPVEKKGGGGKKSLTPGVNKMKGYRIQVFADGRNQASLEARARARGSQIIARFPKYRGQVYTYSSSPNWITRIGNFATQADAQKALQELQRAFPKYASEMRIVNCTVTIIK